ncbi:TM2 domain-containing protein [Candidatus Palauibacter sp.]|uniref:TM2 domain-containing protein n=1 Tax=Candidatus Palauibacter sp. TaxID=3101350 RepID=UPI003B59DD31
MTTTKQKTTVNVNVAAPAQPPASVPLQPKSEGAAFALCLVFGAFGAHRFYLNRPHAVVMLVLALTFVGLGLTMLCAIIDLFSIQRWVQESNAQLAAASDPASVPPAASAALPASATADGELESRLLLAAQERGGRITVTQGVLDTRESFDTVRDCLRGMVEDGYADVGNVPDSGVVVYTFGEL